MSTTLQTHVKATSTTAPPVTSVRHGLLQRKCVCTSGREGCSQERDGSAGVLQRRAANAATPAAVPPIVREVLRSPGQPLDTSTLALMGQSFHHDFSKVRVHTDTHAAESARAVNAQAYSIGRDLVFEMGNYAPGTNVGRSLLAHELAHFVQQGGTDTSFQNKAIGISQPGDPAEQKADLASHAVLHNRSVSDVGDAPTGMIHRLVKTNGGDFDTTNYTAINDATGADAAGIGKMVGARIGLTFTPNNLVEADNIGLLQSVNTQASTAVGGPVNTPNPASPRKGSISLTAAEGEEGRAIDQGDPGDADTIPNTSPLYNVENTPGSVAATLTDVPADPAFGLHAFRKRKAAGGFDVQAGTLGDGPRRLITFAGQQYNQKFEATALVLDGPLANTYLGSIEWGWKNDAAGNATLDPNPIRMVSAGAPTTAFMDAARKWNAATFTDPTTGTVHNTVDLPTQSDDLNSGSRSAADRETGNLIAWIRMVDFQLSNLAAGVDRTNKLFEKRALEAELRTRSLLANIRVVKTTSGPGADDVYMKVSLGGRSVRTRVQIINDGQNGVFAIPLASIVPIDGPLTIEIFEEDTLSADDLVVRMIWALPGIHELRNSNSLKGADYRVAVKFDR